MRLLFLPLIFIFSCSSNTKMDVRLPSKIGDEVKKGSDFEPSAFTISSHGAIGITVNDVGEIVVGDASVGKLLESKIVDENGDTHVFIEEGRVKDSSGQNLVVLDRNGQLDNGSGVKLT